MGVSNASLHSIEGSIHDGLLSSQVICCTIVLLGITIRTCHLIYRSIRNAPRNDTLFRDTRQRRLRFDRGKSDGSMLVRHITFRGSTIEMQLESKMLFPPDGRL